MKMSGSIKNFFKTTAIYGITGSLRSFVELLLLPVYARYLLPAEFGVLDIVMVLLAIATLIVVFELTNGVFRFYFDNKSTDYHRKLISTVMTYNLTLAVIILTVVLIFSDRISLYLFGNPSHANLFLLVAVFLVANAVLTLPVNLFRLQNRPGSYSGISLLQVAITIIGVIYFVAVRKMGIEGVILAKILATLPTIVYSLYQQRSFIRPQVDMRMLFKLAKYSAPLIPAGAALWGINALNRVFLLRYCTMDDIGLFSLALKFTALITLSVIAFQLAWPQFAFETMNKKEAGKTFAKIYSYCTAGAVWMVLFIAFFGQLLLKIQATEAYYPASELMTPLAIGTLLYGSFYLFTTGLSITKKTVMILIPIVVGALTNITLNMILTPSYGVHSVAWITTATYLTMATTMFVIAQKSYFIPFEWKKLTRLALVAGGISLAGNYTSLLGSPVSHVVEAALFLSFPLLLLAVGFFDKSEKQILARRLVMRRKSNTRVATPDSVYMSRSRVSEGTNRSDIYTIEQEGMDASPNR